MRLSGQKKNLLVSALGTGSYIVLGLEMKINMKLLRQLMTIKFARSFHLGALSLRISTLPQGALMEMSASGVLLLTLIEFLL